MEIENQFSFHTSDNMRKKSEEGLESRNLLNVRNVRNITTSDKYSHEVPKTLKKPPSSPRPQSASPKPAKVTKDMGFSETEPYCYRRYSSMNRSKSRFRSSSLGRKKCVRARYWAFLFENLYRAVDAIYQICEEDESPKECKEAIMMLNNYSKDFEALIHWINISKNLECTPPRERPTSLAWEVRRFIPSRSSPKNIFIERSVSNTGASRKLEMHSLPVHTDVKVPTEKVNINDTCVESNSSNDETPSPLCQIISFEIDDDNKENSSNNKNESLKENNIENKKFTMENEILKVDEGNVIEFVKKPSDNQSTLEPVAICEPSLEENSKAEEIEIIVSSPADDLKLKNGSPSQNTLLEKSPACTVSVHFENISTAELEIGSSRTFDVEFLGHDEFETCSFVNESSISKDAEMGCDSIDCSSNLVKNPIENTKPQEIENLITKENLVVADKSNSSSNDENEEISNSLLLIDVPSISKEEVKETVVSELKNNQLEFDELVKKSPIESNGEVKNQDSLKYDQIDSNGETKQDSVKCNLESNGEMKNQDSVKCNLESNGEMKNQDSVKCNLESNGETKNQDSVKCNLIESNGEIKNQDSVKCNQIESKEDQDSSKKTEGKLNGQLEKDGIKDDQTKLNGQLEKDEIKDDQTKLNGQLEKDGIKDDQTKLNGKLEKKVIVKSHLPSKGVAAVALTARKVKQPPVSSIVPATRIVKTQAPISSQRPKPTFPSTFHPTKRLLNTSSSVKEATELKRPSTLVNKPTVVASRPIHSQVIPIKRNNQKPVVKLQATLQQQKSHSSQPSHGPNLITKPIPHTTLNTKSKKADNADSDGWEMVRGRTRCKNSPAKKPNADYDRAVAAKVKVGGFPYTCTSNSIKPKPATAAIKKTAPIGTEKSKNNLASRSKVLNQKEVGKRVSKENIAQETGKKIGAAKTIITSKTATKTGVLKLVSTITKTTTTPAKTPAKTRLVEMQLTVDNTKNKKLKNESLDEISSQKAPSNSIIESKKKDSEETIDAIAKEANTSNLEMKEFEDKLVISQEYKSQEFSEVTEIEKPESLNLEQEGSKELFHKEQDLDLPSFSNDQDQDAFHDDGQIQDDGANDAKTLEMYEKMIREEAQEHIAELGNLSWADQMDIHDMEFRTPGRALQMHEKLSSPFRKRTLAETIRHQEEKQLKAQEQRERFLEEKAQRFKDIQKKVEEMKAFNEKRQEQQRISLEQRLQRAEEKRKKELEKIIKKAHDEEEKVLEIAFINSLEIQNKRHDIISKEKDHEARLQDLQDERQRKLEEKAAKEAAAEERRKILEAERQARLLEMQEKRKLRDLKIEQQMIEKEKERQELANQKAREREHRISALNAAQQAMLEELQKKIQQKQEESARRHEENIEQIRQKAFELTVRHYSSNNDDAPNLVPYETKKICTVCNVLIESEVYLLSHLRGKKHQEMIMNQHKNCDPSTEELEQYNLKHIVDASSEHLDPNVALDKERLNALKKRCKKLRQKMAIRGLEFERCLLPEPLTLPAKTRQKMLNLVQEIKQHATSKRKTSWDKTIASDLVRTFLDLKRVFDKTSTIEKIDLLSSGGASHCLDLLFKLMMPLTNNNLILPNNDVIKRVCQTTRLIFNDCDDIYIYLLLSNKIVVALDILNQRLGMLIPDNFDKLVKNSNFIPAIDEITSELLHLLNACLNVLTKRKSNDDDFWRTIKFYINQNTEEEFNARIIDVVSYIVSIGIVDRLSQYFNCIRGTVNSDESVLVFLNQCMSFLASIVKMSSDNYICQFDRRKTEDITQLFPTLKMTDMAGTISLLYCILLCNGSPSWGDISFTPLPDLTIELIESFLRLLNYAAVLNLPLFQSILGSEGISLQLRHILSYLLWYCKNCQMPSIFTETILLIGYFTALNSDNQLILQAGQSPSVMVQLATLPFESYQDDNLKDTIYPTFISCCYNCEPNKEVLEKEVPLDIISKYIERHLLNAYEISEVKNDENIRLRLHSRFPKFKWTSSKQYFAVKAKKNKQPAQ